MPGRRSLPILALLALAAWPQDNKAPKIDQKKIDEAIDRGCEYLMKNAAAPAILGDADMLVFLTLLHGGVRTERLQAFIDRAMTRELKRTYNVSLLAMCLYELWKLESEAAVKEKYLMRAHQCAQWLIDNQTAHGQWRYGHPVPLPPMEEKKPPKDTVDTKGSDSNRPKNGGVNTIVRPPEKDGKGGKIRYTVTANKRAYGTDGDNSNSQYAALGLRACYDMGILIPKEVLERAIAWWETNQNSDGGWGYSPGGAASDSSWGSMTAGAIGALAIYKFYLTRDFKRVQADKSIQRGCKWIEENWAVDQNPKKGPDWHFYYLYGLERAGMLVGTEFMGRYEWYPIGAEWLLKKQGGDGSWSSGGGAGSNVVWDTCFAILFLRRATRPLTIETRRSEK